MMIDGHHTTHDWQVYTGGICVLPIGSFEQHGPHLPLDTDMTSANYFARILAEELDAALLPILSFGTCAEHSGFRGSISLRPETLMQLVRDVAEQVEQQNFRVLLIVHGHGGNFSLGPVVRDINRADRTLKILLVNWWEHCASEEICPFDANRLEAVVNMDASILGARRQGIIEFLATHPASD